MKPTPNIDESNPLTPLVRVIVAATIAELLPHLRSDDEHLPLAEAADLAGIRGKNPARTLRDRLRRDGVGLDRSGNISRAALQAWLASHPVTEPAITADPRAGARDSLSKAAARLRRAG